MYFKNYTQLEHIEVTVRDLFCYRIYKYTDITEI